MDAFVDVSAVNGSSPIHLMRNFECGHSGLRMYVCMCSVRSID